LQNSVLGPLGLSQDIQEILARRRLGPTDREALLKARLGQGAFRTGVLALWANRCAVTGCGVLEAIRASHIRPWSKSTDDERLDSKNGLPLVANLDALFDVGLISFDDTGKMLVSANIPRTEQALLGLQNQSLRHKPDEPTRRYLEYHRREAFDRRNA
jgi:predicted restriction endonuclease